MKLKTADLKKFLALANHVQFSNIIPILAYIKLQNGELSKTNLRTHVKYAISEGDYEDVLLEEKILSEIVKKTKDDEINVIVKGAEVVVSDKVQKFKFPLFSVKDFPEFPTHSKEEVFEMEYELLEAIGIASKQTAKTQMEANIEFVHLKDGYVFGSNGHRMYLKKFENLPNAVIDVECAEVVSKFNSATFHYSDNYNFFELPNTVYAFVKKESKTPDFKKFIQDKDEENHFYFSSSDFIDFCDTVVSIANSKYIDCTWKGNKLSFKDDGFERSYEVELSSTGDFKPDILFDPKGFGAFFRSLGVDYVTICSSNLPEAITIWDNVDANFFGLLIGLAKQDYVSKK